MCFVTDKEVRGASWVQPCRCRGSSRWVHSSCLLRWIDERQKGQLDSTVQCSQCQVMLYHVLKIYTLCTAFEACHSSRCPARLNTERNVRVLRHDIDTCISSNLPFLIASFESIILVLFASQFSEPRHDKNLACDACSLKSA